MHTLFIADLHLSADRPDIIAAFNQFLDTDLDDVEALYILGDLFEVWVGDDIAEPFSLDIADKLKSVSRTIPIYFIHGNRDFLIGQQYANACGMTLLPEVTLISLYGHNTVILHGDSLCTLDKPYQRFRKFRNIAWVKWLYSHLPIKKRLGIAANIRAKSQKGNQTKSYTIMDVEQEAVDKLLSQTKASIMIHGHTHRPAVHEINTQQKRIVLGDWYEQTSILNVSKDGIKLETFSLPVI